MSAKETRIAVEKPSFEKRFDLRSFGEPLKRLRSVRIEDVHEPLVDLREFCTSVVLQPGCLPFLRQTVARMVNDAQEFLPIGIKLTVGTALRTREMQRGIHDHLHQELVEKHPEWSLPTLRRMLNRMVAPPDDISPPPHTTGAALDVGLVNSEGAKLDFSSPVEGWDAAPTYCHRISEEAQSNRVILISAMERAGLTNYVGEWWHWSYGDQGWALRVGNPVAYYDYVEIENAEGQRIPKPMDNLSTAD